jgi:putative hydrolase of the HAD superfamily
LALRAVIFDYGMVLTGPQDSGCHQALLRIIGLPPARFESLYWADRHAYDEGKLTGITFWQKLVHEAGLNLAPGTVEQLSNLDARMWSTENPAMLAWQLQLKQRGLLTAILSNMGDNVLASVERTFNWLPRFDVLIWSYQWHMAKPDPAIYRLCLDKLGVRPDESLFLDDKLINVEAAHSLGIKAIHFTTIERLRQDLIAQGLDADIPLP